MYIHIAIYVASWYSSCTFLVAQHSPAPTTMAKASIPYRINVTAALLDLHCGYR